VQAVSRAITIVTGKDVAHRFAGPVRAVEFHHPGAGVSTASAGDRGFGFENVRRENESGGSGFARHVRRPSRVVFQVRVVTRCRQKATMAD